MLSGIILAQNTEEAVQAKKQLDFCDEIIIDIAKSTQDFSKRRNKLLQKAKGDWVLYLDTDETITPDLKKSILEAIKNDSHKAYAIQRVDVFWRKELKFGETSLARNKGIVRLVRKKSGTWKGKVHETFFTDNPVEILQGHLVHEPHRNIKEFLHDVNYYSTLRAEELFDTKHKTNVFEIICMPLGKFLYTYLLKLGILDGAAGFVYSFMMSFHSFLVRSKLYLKQN